MVTEEALNAIKCLRVLQELDSDPALEELNKDLDFLDSVKAPENESIPSEVLKCCKGNIINLWAAWNTLSLNYHRTRGMQTSSPCRTTMALIAITICISLLSVTGKRFAQMHWRGSRFWRRDSTQNRNVASKPTGQPLMWCSPSDSCRTTAGNNGDHSS